MLVRLVPRRAIARLVRRSALAQHALVLAQRVLVPRQRVGSLGVLLDARGRVLLAEHLFRPRYPWGLPGGWLARNEHPARGVERELREELGIDVEVVQLLMAEPHGPHSGRGTAPGLSIVYRCRVRPDGDAAPVAWELLGVAWFTPEEAMPLLRRFEQEALRLALVSAGFVAPVVPPVPVGGSATPATAS
jgi:ADP-ribose pyrophosphatase YjhB (NUDIX family)